MLKQLPDQYVVPLDVWIQAAVKWVVDEWRPVFQALRWPIAQLLDSISAFLLFWPFWAVIVVATLAAWRLAGWKNGLFAGAALTLIAFLGLWQPAILTLAMVFTAVTFNVVVGVPLGIVAARSDRFWAGLRPVLDFMQTTPSFVYLVPVVMLFGIGTVPGVIATIIFSLPPMIRLTNLGIRQVPYEVVEAGMAYGATEWQSLREIRLPLGLPSIMAGLNQTLLLAMVMSVIASMIGAEGLGLTVLRGIGRLDVGLAAIGGLSIVLLAMILDRTAQAVGERSRFSAETEKKPALGRWVGLVLGRTSDRTSQQNARGAAE